MFWSSSWKQAGKRSRLPLSLEMLEQRTVPSIDFGPPTLYVAHNSPYAIATRDLNGDGRLDLVAPILDFSQSVGEVSVQLGNGDGTFQAAQYYTSGPRPDGVVVADFDGDGNLDLATSDYATNAQGSGLLSVLWGNSDGTFPVHSNYLANVLQGAPLGIAVGDFNGDDRPDLATADAINTVSVTLNAGNRTFLTPSSHAVGAQPGAVLGVGDFDHDGRQDLAVPGFANDTLKVLLGNGDGTFGAAVSYGVGDQPYAVTVGEFNGDGDPDLAVANYASSQLGNESVTILLGNGDGTFQAGVGYGVSRGPQWVVASDLDGDGQQDLVTSNDFTNTVSILVGNGDGTFQARQDFPTGTGPRSVAVGNFSSDGLPDLATVGLFPFGVHVLLQIPTNQPPTANAGGPYAIAEGATLSLDASASSDPDDDPLTYSWTINGHPGAASGMQPTLTWAQLQALGIDDGPGGFPITVTVDDGHDHQVTSPSTSLSLSNTPPTAFLSAPPAANPEGTTIQLTGSASDPSTADSSTGFTYAWSVTKNGDAFASGTGSAVSFTPDDNGSYVVQVTATDKDSGASSPVSTTIAVDNRAPAASIAGPSDGVPGQARVFTVDATDPSAVDQAAGFTFQIAWGDSTMETLTGPSGITASHVYTLTGPYTIQVTATDKDLGTSSLATQVVTITLAALQTDPFDATRTALAVGGTTAADTIVIRGVDHLGTVNVVVNGVSQGSFQPSGHILAYGQAGDDLLQLAFTRSRGAAHHVTAPALLFGGGGNDTLDTTGSLANNVLVGEAGNDNLRAGSKRDLLIGGLGADSLNGGSGDDILIGATTDFDADLPALNAILTEWGRADADYATRVSHLNGSLGGGLNGSYFLTAATVHDDADTDLLTGGKGTDWFFALLSGTSLDQLLELARNEIVTPL